MPARRVYEDQMPSFMSVFDLDAETMADRETVTVVNPKLVGVAPKVPALGNSSQQADILSGCIPPDATHKHHDSTSTLTSESADSSPTTTLSTTDSSSLSDPSPSSSPDSPLNNFHSATFGASLNGTSPLSISNLNTLERPITSPTLRRPRNMKGLSIQPPAAATALSNSIVSEPCSPSFIKPKIPAMKRKPSLLSLKTNSSDFMIKTLLDVPASPAMPPISERRALKHATSSPHILSSLKTSTFGQAGGMSFPKMLERNESGLSEVLRPMKSLMNPTFNGTILEEESPIRMQLANRSDAEPHHERDNNEDQKSPGYPSGPIAIYGDNVYLYSEPTAEEASRFDVVINVAREVKNPFEGWQQVSVSPSRGGDISQGQATSTVQGSTPDTSVPAASYATAWEHQSSDDKLMVTPTMAKANVLSIPEYIHVPWDHNTDISPDLLKLCDIVQSRIKEGKKVLVHCQQGASRSASLIIAFGLYQHPELSVNDAYYAAQSKSRWISPNMKLMYSLQDFHKELSKNWPPPTSSAYRSRPGRSPTKHRFTLSVDAIEMASKEPLTAPLPAQNARSNEQDDNVTSNSRLGVKSGGLHSISPGPASAPLTFSWREALEQSHKEQKEPEQKKHKQAELEQEESEQKGLEQTPKHVELPTSFKLQAPPQRPKSAQGRTKPSLAPFNGSLMKPTPLADKRCHSSLGFQNNYTCPQEQAPSELSFAKAFAISSAFLNEDLPNSPRAETMTINPLRECSEIAGMRFITSQEQSGSLFSPRQSMFPREVCFSFGRPTQMADPRSPPTKGEAPIIRSIDDIL